MRLTPRRRAWRDLALLAGLCLPLYFWGLTTHGVTNWQEAQRLVVAREMQARGEWLVPTLGGRPYLAKPPLVYWCQLGLAKATGGPVDLWHLRLTVALAGLLGVLATYGAARVLVPGPGAAPLWSALLTATGFLYVRSSRIGELDILLAPTVVAAVAGVALAWRRWRETRSVAYGWLALGALAGSLAALAKGPPALLVIGLAAYGGIALHAAFTPAEHREHRAPSGTRAGVVMALIGFLAVAAAAALNLGIKPDLGGYAGVALLALAGAALADVLFRLTDRERARRLWCSLAGTHPLAVLGVPALVLWGWYRAVESRVGAGAAGLVSEESENLALFHPGAPLANLEGLAYGAGLGSVLGLAALVMLARRRVAPVRPEWFILVAWVALGVTGFSVLGKGVPRYLTPLWPALSMLGGLLLGTLIGAARDRSGQRRLSAALGFVIFGLAAGQAWWYGHAREHAPGSRGRSPGALVAALRAQGFGPDRLATLEFRTPAVDYYAGRTVPAVGDVRMREAMAGQTPLELDEFAGLVRRSGGPWAVLVRAERGRSVAAGAPAERLRAAGLAVRELSEPVPEFVIDRGRTRVLPVIVRAAP
ncbi:MAG TPA: phospholipid carrier-dependent glycosyltransferase [Phycisphaerales bacterium]|nr:phospholipid carrier-dependent glycosyltransferase [Phycisphaerales bacterium]